LCPRGAFADLFAAVDVFAVPGFFAGGFPAVFPVVLLAAPVFVVVDAD
jgi:hypothetical protein